MGPPTSGRKLFTNQSEAGLLTSGSSLPAAPSHVSAVACAAFVPGYSGGTATDSHRLPYSLVETHSPPAPTSRLILPGPPRLSTCPAVYFWRGCAKDATGRHWEQSTLQVSLDDPGGDVLTIFPGVFQAPGDACSENHTVITAGPGNVRDHGRSTVRPSRSHLPPSHSSVIPVKVPSAEDAPAREA